MNRCTFHQNSSKFVACFLVSSYSPIYRASRRAGYPCNLHRAASSSSSITLSSAGDVAFPRGTSTLTTTATSKGRADIKGVLYKSITDDKASATVAAERRRRPRKLDYLECRCLVYYGQRENERERKGGESWVQNEW